MVQQNIIKKTLKDSGNFSSPNYTSLYPAASYYHWTLQAAEGKRLELTLHSIDVENLFDSVKFSGHPFIFTGNFSGMSLTLYSVRQREVVIFKSDQTVQRGGFTASFSSVDADDRRYSSRD